MDILPIPRIGAGYHDTDLHENFSSATAIRHNLGKDSLSDSVPSYVLSDLPEENCITQTFEEWTRLALIDHSAEQLSHVFGCTEGLENKLKSLATLPYDKIIEGATTKRYSSTRIRRILCANLLKLDANQTKSFLEHLYIRPLAVDKGNADRLLSYLGEAKLPVVIKERERQKLSQTALECLDINDYADLIYGAITKTTKTSYTMLKV
jgi:predicted nucleotidyltransferase